LRKRYSAVTLAEYRFFFSFSSFTLTRVQMYLFTYASYQTLHNLQHQALRVPAVVLQFVSDLILTDA